MHGLQGKTVLITGGTGSFGNTVVRQLISGGEAKTIIVFSRDEKKQHDMRLALASDKVRFEIGDVRDAERVNRLMAGVDMVFHAAALKHVPACEFFPMEAVKTNIIGTHNVIEAAINRFVEKVVVLSTDKAAYPVNAMGCSKMMMEKVMIARAQSGVNNHKTTLCGVRYGNVLFSRGSVLPLFFDQIEQGNALTLTDPGMTRFLMPLSNAVDLVLHALRNGTNGDLFIHKAKAATVGDLAKACLKLKGARNPVTTIGVRAGEKMDETLATAEELARAQDQHEYWRIPFESDQDDERFFSSGKIELAQIDPFTSANAERLQVVDICRMISELPEYKKRFPS